RLEQMARERDRQNKEEAALRQQLKQLREQFEKSQADAKPTSPPPNASLTIRPGRQNAFPSQPTTTRTGTAQSRKSAEEAQLAQKLLEVDLKEAQIGVSAAETELQRLQDIRKKSPSGVSESELQQAALKIQLSQIQAQKI